MRLLMLMAVAKRVRVKVVFECNGAGGGKERRKVHPRLISSASSQIVQTYCDMPESYSASSIYCSHPYLRQAWSVHLLSEDSKHVH